MVDPKSKQIESTTKHLFEQACGIHANIKQSREAGNRIIKLRDEIIVLNMPLAAHLAHKFHQKGGRKHEYEDIHSAACMGLVEAVDNYEPKRNGKFAGWALFRIRKNMVKDWMNNHWKTCKPPKKISEAFYAGNLTEDQFDEYINTYINRISFLRVEEILEPEQDEEYA